MKIESLRELKRLIQLCRSQGVESFKLDSMEFHLSAIDPKVAQRQVKQAIKRAIDPGIFDPGAIPEPKADEIETDELTQEQLLMWSAIPHSEESPQ